MTVTPFYLAMNETKVRLFLLCCEAVINLFSIQHIIKCVMGDGEIVEVQPKNVIVLCVCLIRT